MITVTYGNMNDNDFNSGVSAIDTCPSLNVKTMCAFNKFMRIYDKERENAKTLFGKILDKYTVMETTGEGDKIVSKPKTETVGGVTRRVFTDEAAMDAEMKHLLTESFEVPINPIPLSDLTAAKLSPRQTRSLSPLLISEDEVQVGPKLVSK